jgi:hypothetical protein
MKGWSDYNLDSKAQVTDADKVIDLDKFEPETPDVATPQEKPSNFWGDVQSGLKKGTQKIAEFLSSPELAKFARAANIVFAGAMVVAAGVMISTGVGAPAGLAALALAGGGGLVMQFPAVHDKLEAGVVALMSPVLGQDTAEKLGPLVTQGLIAGIMVAIVATGGQAGSAQGALDATVGVFNNLKDIFSGISQVYQQGGPILENFGINVDPKALQNMAAVFGSMSVIMPDLSNFTEGLGSSLKDFLANPDMDAFKDFLGALKNLPESITTLINSDFLNNLGGILESGENLFDSFNENDFFQNLSSILGILNQVQQLKA